VKESISLEALGKVSITLSTSVHTSKTVCSDRSLSLMGFSY
jgi:hypothetical protein